MADIELRFHKDMLVLSAPVETALCRQGVSEQDIEFINLLEPETVQNVYRMESIAGAQCLVTNTEGICQSRLAHKRLEDRQQEIAQSAFDTVCQCKPQHVICEIGPCGLPLDFTSEASCKQTQDQYADAVRAFGEDSVDAFLLTGMNDIHDMKCALEGARSVTQRPLFASFNVDERGCIEGKDMTIEEALVQLGDKADVYGFTSGAELDTLCEIATRMAKVTQTPLLAQVRIVASTDTQRRRAVLGAPIPGNPYPVADVLVDVSSRLRAAGVQFLRATGQATPAFTGALAVTSAGFDCVR